MHRLTVAASLVLGAVLLASACGEDPHSTPAAAAGSSSGAAGAAAGAAPSAGHGPHAGTSAAGHAGLGGQPSAGTSGGGQVGQEQGGTAGGPSDVPTWLTDESLWEPLVIDGLPWDDCTVAHAKPAALGPSGFAWTSCGEGCALLDTTWLDVIAEFSSLGHVQRASVETTLLTASWYRPPYGVRLVIALETGQIVNALRGVSLTESATPKYAGGWWREPRFFPVSPLLDGKHGQVSDLWLAEDGSLERTFLHTTPKVGTYFFLDAAKGMQFLGGGQVLRAGFGEPMTQFEVVAKGTSVLDGEGQGDLVVWLDNVSSSLLRVRGWRTDGKGTRDVLDIPRDAARPNAYSYPIGLSATRMVGVLSYSTPEDIYTTSEARVWMSPRPLEGQLAALQLSPALPGDVTPLTPAEVKTWGDYALLRMYDVHKGKGSYWVVHLPSWTIYVLENEGKTKFTDRTFGIDGTFVYAGVDAEGFGTQMTQVKRWELAKLGQSATRVLHVP